MQFHVMMITGPIIIVCISILQFKSHEILMTCILFPSLKFSCYTVNYMADDSIGISSETSKRAYNNYQ